MKHNFPSVTESIAILFTIYISSLAFTVPSYDLVDVTSVDHLAKSHSRVRRSLHGTLPIFLHFKAYGLDFHLNVTLNKNLLPEGSIVEYCNGDTVQRLKGIRNTYSIGKVASDPESLVALDHKSGVVSLKIAIVYHVLAIFRLCSHCTIQYRTGC